ncbi:MAG: sigma-70 family RNA polymerase sigma factor [Gammaproteobacteria bacterium]
MPQRHLKLSDHRVISPTDSALALKLVTEMDLLRLKAISRLHARGLPPDVGWEDMLQEALTRVLTGARQQPEGVPIVAFLAGIMRSLRTDHLRRARRGAGKDEGLRLDQKDDESAPVEIRDPTPDPERAVSAVQELVEIKRLFADDPIALKIIAGLAEGLEAEQIRAAKRLSKIDYDSARRRMRRCLPPGGAHMPAKVKSASPEAMLTACSRASSRPHRCDGRRHHRSGAGSGNGPFE